jgi:hypothetical protein
MGDGGALKGGEPPLPLAFYIETGIAEPAGDFSGWAPPLRSGAAGHHGRPGVHPHSEIVELHQLKLQITGPDFGEDAFLRF